MRQTVARMVSSLRQWSFPPEFRIDTGDGLDPGELLVRAVGAAILAAEKTPSPAPPPPRPPPTTPAGPVATGGIEMEFACSLCGDLFRLRRNVAQVVAEGKETKEIRSIQRALERVDSLLSAKGVEYIDLTGRAWTDRDLDFDPMGQPEIDPTLDVKRIAVCERPLVKMGGKIVQRAKGTIKKPPTG